MSQSARDLAANVRHELAAIIPTRTCCRAAELDGLRDAGHRADVATARTIHRLIDDGETESVAGTPAERARRRASQLIRPGAPQHCRLAFLRGRVLARGSLSLANGSVHLEIVLAPDEAASIHRAFEIAGLSGHLRERRGRGVVVWKSRAEVLDLLRRLGARGAVAEIEARSVLREVRGELNRSINAETANLRRSVVAGMRQADAIRTLEADGALDEGGRTRRVAEARRAHPDATITELGEQLQLSRSAVQRTLAALERQAEALKRRALP